MRVFLVITARFHNFAPLILIDPFTHASAPESELNQEKSPRDDRSPSQLMRECMRGALSSQHRELEFVIVCETWA